MVQTTSLTSFSAKKILERKKAQEERSSAERRKESSNLNRTRCDHYFKGQGHVMMVKIMNKNDKICVCHYLLKEITIIDINADGKRCG